MSIGLKTGDGDVILFDAVTNYSNRYGGQVTSHPVESGKSVTDHVIHANPVFSIDGVVSSADFASDSVQVELINLREFDIESVGIVKRDETTSGIEITYDSPSRLSSLIPESIRNLVSDPQLPVVNVIAENSNPPLRTVKEKLLKFKNEATPVDIMILDGNNIEDIITGCLISEISFAETPDTGNALEFSMTLEQVTYVTLNQSTVPMLAWKEINTGEVSEKGRQAGAEGPGGSTPGSQGNPEPVDDFSTCIEEERKTRTVSAAYAVCMARGLGG